MERERLCDGKTDRMGKHNGGNGQQKRKRSNGDSGSSSKASKRQRTGDKHRGGKRAGFGKKGRGEKKPVVLTREDRKVCDDVMLLLVEWVLCVCIYVPMSQLLLSFVE